MSRIPSFVFWLYRLVVLSLFLYVARFYIWVFWELLVHQELIVFETNLTMNRIEFGIATGIGLVAIVSFLIHLGRFKGIIYEKTER